MEKKIVIFQRVLAHYRLPIFKKINRVTGAILCFGKGSNKRTFLSKVKPDCPHLEIKDFYPYSKIDTCVFLDVFKPLSKYKPAVIVTEFALWIISNYLLLFLRPFLGYKLILWSHGYNRKRGFHPERCFADKLRLWWMSNADAVILYGGEAKNKISPYLKNPAKMFVAQNTLDTNNLLRIRDRLEQIGKERIKRAIGFTRKYNLIFIGRLLQEKQPDRLIDVYRIASEQMNSVSLHFIGDGPMREELIMQANKMMTERCEFDIRFWGSMTDDEQIGKMLYASDMMVMPGYLGLAVVHSFCFDCPVVSQKQGLSGPFHSPEVEYLVDGKTGFLVEYGNNERIAEEILSYLQDHEKQEQMRQEIRRMPENICSVDNMVQGFKEAVEYVLRG